MVLAPLVLSLLSADSRLPPECAPPPLHDVAALKDLASLDGAFSAGLDAVATWCFDSGGNWTAGKGKAALKGAKRTPSEDAPAGDCAKAIVSCESTEEVLKNKEPLRELAHDARADLDRTYKGQHYTPKRTGLKEVPSEKADCRSKNRTELFQMAQHRMDLARLTSQIQNEYGNYKTWLFTRGLECRNAVLANKKDPTKRNLTIDDGVAAQNAEADAGTAPGSAGTTVASVTPAPTGGAVSSTPEVKAAVGGDWLPKWKLLAKLHAVDEADRDYTMGFLASKEWKGCNCEKVNPSALARSIEKKEGGEVGLTLLREEDAAKTACELCLLDTFPTWRTRANKDCDGMDALSDTDFDKLRKSDQAYGIPPRCFDESSQHRTEKLIAAQQAKAEADRKKIEELNNAALAAMAKDGGAPMTMAQFAAADGGSKPVVSSAAVASDAGSTVASPAGLQTVNGYTYYHAGSGTTGAVPATGGTTAGAAPADAGATVAAGTPGNQMTAPSGPTPPAFSTTIGGSGASGRDGVVGPGTPSGPGVSPRGAYESFNQPEQWAPVPQREEGRIYVRLFMSSACVATIDPGPLEARTGDLLLLPYEARFVQVKSPCGGLAEVYFGRQPKPAVSELFGKNKPIRFEFKPQ
ncbi:MAG: hypothetical protein QM723_32320 [Myxococcaceae bacterium]